MKNLILNVITFVFIGISLTAISAQNRTITKFPKAFGKLCPNTQQGHLKNGDHEFGGPVASNFTVQFYVNDNKVYAHVFLDMQENNNNPNRTQVKADWKRIIYTVPEGQEVKRLTMGQLSHARFITQSSKKVGKGGGFEASVFGCNDAPSTYMYLNKMRVQIEYKGDTGASDVSTDRNCDCDSRVEEVTFDSPLKILIGKRQPIVSKEYYIKSTVLDKVMSVKHNKTANGTVIDLWKNVAQDNQLFILENAGGGYFYIKSKKGKYIHIKNDASTPKSLVVIWSGKGNDNTKWKFIPVGKNEYYIQSKKGYYLDAQLNAAGKTAPIWVEKFNGRRVQRWTLDVPIRLL